MNNQYEVTIEHENETSAILVIRYHSENSNILCGLNITVHEVTRKYSVDPSNISNIHVTKENNNRKIEIEYTK